MNSKTRTKPIPCGKTSCNLNNNYSFNPFINLKKKKKTYLTTCLLSSSCNALISLIVPSDIPSSSLFKDTFFRATISPVNLFLP